MEHFKSETILDLLLYFLCGYIDIVFIFTIWLAQSLKKFEPKFPETCSMIFRIAIFR